MGLEDFPKTKPEIKKETPEHEPDEKVLNPEEIEKLGGEMDEYTAGLKTRIDEIKIELENRVSKKKQQELQAELEELQIEYDGLTEFATDIHSGNFEEITEKPHR
jgi:hypothetical protein